MVNDKRVKKRLVIPVDAIKPEPIYEIQGER